MGIFDLYMSTFDGSLHLSPLQIIDGKDN